MNNKEIERKFLIDPKIFKSKLSENIILGNISNDFQIIEQFYISNQPTTRIRLVENRKINDYFYSQLKSYFTVKGKSENITRTEIEFEIPFESAYQIGKMFDKKLRKIRLRYMYCGYIYELDIFSSKNLYIAEIELKTENDEILIPDWFGKEVSTDENYYNVNLI